MDRCYISIIIPMFNAEKYIEECIESILAQKESFSDFEVIIIDDGSQDNSLIKCDKYIQNKEITILKQENKGASAARNAGLIEARGKYILFVDADDYIEKNSLINIARACKAQNEPDILFLKGMKTYLDGRFVPIEKDYDFERLINKTREEVFCYLSSRNKFNASPCLKMLKKTFLEDKKIIFEVGKRVEDLNWSMNCFINAESYGCYNGDYYYYRQQISNSNSARFEDSSYRDAKEVINKWIDLAGMEGNIKLHDYILSFTCYEYIILLANCKDYILNDKLWHKKMKMLYHYRKDKKALLICFLSNIIGIYNTSKLLNLYIKNR